MQRAGNLYPVDEHMPAHFSTTLSWQVGHNDHPSVIGRQWLSVLAVSCHAGESPRRTASRVAREAEQPLDEVRPAGSSVMDDRSLHLKIGRASCRERV